MDPAAPEPAPASGTLHASPPGVSGAGAEAAEGAHSEPQLDVAIVGGGPGGLAAAKAILTASPGLRVGVFERALLRPRGAAVMLQPNGIRALEAIDPSLAAAVQAVDSPQGKSRIYRTDGTQVAVSEENPMDYIRQHGGPIVMAAWHEVQAALARALPPGVLHQQAVFERLEQGPGGVTLRFAGGRPPVTARVVAGADGSQSLVRQQVLGDGPPLYADTAAWRAVTAEPEWWPQERCPRYCWGAPPTVFLAAGLHGGQAFGKWPAERLDEIGGRGGVYVQDEVARREAGEARRRRCLEVYGSWCPQVRDLIQAADPLAITEHGQFYRDPDTCKVWGRGRASLLGDAAHLATPFLAQGSSQAFEDALELGRAIGQHGPTEEALRAYEAARLPLSQPVQRASVGLWLDFKAGKPAPQEWLESEKLGVWQRRFEPLPRPAAGA